MSKKYNWNFNFDSNDNDNSRKNKEDEIKESIPEILSEEELLDSKKLFNNLNIEKDNLHITPKASKSPRDSKEILKKIDSIFDADIFSSNLDESPINYPEENNPISSIPDFNPEELFSEPTTKNKRDSLYDSMEDFSDMNVSQNDNWDYDANEKYTNALDFENVNPSKEPDHFNEYRIKCQNCDSLKYEHDYDFPLCPKCRDILSRYPLPIWVKAVGIFIVLFFFYTLFRYPTTVGDSKILLGGQPQINIKHYSSSIKTYTYILNYYPNSVDAKYGLYKSYVYNFDFDKATNLMNEFDSTLYTRALISKENDLLLSANLKATKFMIDATKLNPDLVNLVNKKKVMKLEDYIKALTAYVNKNTKDPLAFVELSKALTTYKKYKEAAQVMTSALKLRPDFGFLRVDLIEIYTNFKNYDEATREASKLVEDMPEYVPGLVESAKLYLKTTRYAESIDNINLALTFDEKNLDYKSILAIALHLNKKSDEAEIMLEELKTANYKDYQKTKDIIRDKTSYEYVGGY